MAITIRDWMLGDPNLDEELQLMRSKDKALHARAEDIATQIDADEMEPGRKRKRQVENWLKNVEELHEEVQCIEEDVQKATFSRKMLKRQILSVTKELDCLLAEGDFTGGFTLYDHASSGVPLVTTELKGSLFHESLTLVLSWLADDNVCRIGIYGLGGVGKTTLAMHIHNKLHESSKSSSVNVYWVTVSQECTVASLQHKIARVAGVDNLLEMEDEIKNAAVLCAALKKRKKVILFLDDMWKHFPLDRVGIPVEKGGCKLIITTRLLDVSRRMECQQLVKVNPLSENEAWELFTEKIGNFDDLCQEAKALTKLVAKKCAGLPLGILTIAGSLMGVDDVEEWQNTLEELSNCTRHHDDMEHYVFPLLELSYARLNDTILQKCFLSCAFYPEDSKIERSDLIRLWISDCLLEDIDSREKQLDKGHTLLNRLINASLLESVADARGKYGKFLKMHDLVRDMAIKIGKETHHYMIYPGRQLTEVPGLPQWTENLTKVSLISNNISHIPVTVSPVCSLLSTLLLDVNPLKSIPDSFLLHLKGLRFLNISRAQIEKLPDCISDLENLSSLVMRSCSFLRYIPSVAKLVKLRELDLCFCNLLEDLPLGFEGLTNLRFLGLMGCDTLSVQFDRLTSGLSYAEALNLGYGVRGVNGMSLMKLERLRRVQNCWMPNVSDFNTYIKSRHCCQLKNYQFIIGSYSLSDARPHVGRRVLVCGLKLNETEESKPLMLPENIQFLEFIETSVKSLSDALFERQDLTQLVGIWIGICQGLQYIWSSSSANVFGSLKKLHLSDLANLKAIIKPGIPFPGMYKLKKLTIEYCGKMKQLFTYSVVKQLRNLEVLEMQVCGGIEHLIAQEVDCCSDVEGTSSARLVPENANEGPNIICFPKLRKLQLVFIYDLVDVCCGGLFGSDHIEEIIIVNCPKVKTFPFSLPRLPDRRPAAPVSLQSICCERTWWESLEWDDSQSPESLEPFINFCPAS